LEKASKPKSGLAYAMSWNENPANSMEGRVTVLLMIFFTVTTSCFHFIP